MTAENPNEGWRIPPELQQPLPRTVQLRALGITYCISALASILFGLGLSSYTVNEELRRQANNESLSHRLSVEGRATAATVTRLSTGMGYVVGYEYTVDQQMYQKSAFIASEHWQSLQVGSPLAIHYLPSDPSQSYPDGDQPNSQNHWSIALALTGMILLFMFGFAGINLSAVLPQYRLLARGETAHGTVTGCKPGAKGRHSGYFVFFDFLLPDGGKCQGKILVATQIADGSAVTVVYDPKNPRRNALYPMETVRVEA